MKTATQQPAPLRAPQTEPTPQPSIQVRRAEDRGQVHIDWLRSRHSFSFGSYYDPKHMGFSDLRVINEDRVRADSGFGTHGHRHMEILSYVIEGELAHKDSTGSGGIIVPGRVQLMSAGTGIRHSELNPSLDQEAHFLQIWIEPAETGTPPGYQEQDFLRKGGLTLLASPSGRESSLTIRQDVDIYRLIMDSDEQVSFSPSRDNVWIQLVRGQLTLGDVTLHAGDGAAVRNAAPLSLTANDSTEALIFDLR